MARTSRSRPYPERPPNDNALAQADANTQNTGSSGPTPSLGPPQFLEVLQRAGLTGSNCDWGFVVYRTDYTDEEQYLEFKRRFDRLARFHLDSLQDVPGVDEAERGLRFLWREDPSLDGATAEEVDRRYKSEFLTLPRGHALPLALLITSRSLTSVLNTPPPPPNQPSSWPPEQAPFVVAVHTSGPVADDDQDTPPVRTFNVAIEHLVDEAWPVLARRDQDPWQMCPDAGPEDLWFARLMTVRIAGG